MSDSHFGIVMPLIIDGEAYSQRDREMFVAGYEFCLLHMLLEQDDSGMDRPVRIENEERIRVLCNRLGRVCEISPHDETWARLQVSPK